MDARIKNPILFAKLIFFYDQHELSAYIHYFGSYTEENVKSVRVHQFSARIWN